MSITDMLDAFDLFVAKGRVIDALDISFDDKVIKLEALNVELGIA